MTQAPTGSAARRDTVTDRVSAWVERRPGPRDILDEWREHALPDQWAGRFTHIVVSSRLRDQPTQAKRLVPDTH